MRKLVIPAIGIALVAIDFRPGPVDLLVDPVGWAMVAVGTWMLRARVVAGLAVAAGLLSTAGVHFAYRYVFVDPSTHEVTEYCESAIACTPQFRFDDLTNGRTMVLALAAVLGAAALSLLAQTLRTEVGSAEHQVTLRRQLRVLEVLIPVTWAVPMLVLTANALTSDNTYDPIWNGNPAYTGAIRGLVLLWLAVVLVMFANEIPRPVRNPRTRGNAARPRTSGTGGRIGFVLRASQPRSPPCPARSSWPPASTPPGPRSWARRRRRHPDHADDPHRRPVGAAADSQPRPRPPSGAGGHPRGVRGSERRPHRPRARTRVQLAYGLSAFPRVTNRNGEDRHGQPR